MPKKQCCICGEIFNARQSNYIYCSEKCRKEARYQRWKLCNSKGTEYWNTIYPKIHEKHRVIKYCKICNCELPHGKQTYCLDCLLKMYMNNNKSKAFHILSSTSANRIRSAKISNKRNSL